MFTRQKKKSYQTFLYTAVVITLCFLIIALLWPQENTEEPDPQTVNAHSALRQSEDDPNTEDADAHGSQNGGGEDAYGDDNEEDSDDTDAGDADLQDPNGPDDKKNNMTDDPDSYYLVKRADGRIKVFFVNADGSMIELEDTSIVYEVLGPEDQKLFNEGCRVETQEALAVLLQDFES